MFINKIVRQNVGFILYHSRQIILTTICDMLKAQFYFNAVSSVFFVTLPYAEHRPCRDYDLYKLYTFNIQNLNI